MLNYFQQFEESRKRWDAFKTALSPSRRADFAVRLAEFFVDQFFKLPSFDGFIVANFATGEIKQTFNGDWLERHNGWTSVGNLIDWNDYDVTIILLDVNLFFNTVVSDVRSALENLQPVAKFQAVNK